VFLGSAAAAAAAGAGVLASDMPVFAQRRDDPIVRELRRQLRAGVRQMRGARPGEGARAVSAALAFGAVYARTADLDASLKGSLRRIGRRRLTDPEIDPAYVIGIMRDHGLADPRLPPLADLTTREKVYDQLVGGGITALFEREASTFAAASSDLDRFTGVFRPVRVNANCQPTMDSITFWSGVVAVACSPIVVGTGAGAYACAGATGILAGFLIAYATFC
jgi:hypothetical protein